MTGQLTDPAAELALLEVCLRSKNARIQARRIVVAADFYHPAHESLYAAMGELDRQGRDVDLVTVRDQVSSSGLAPQPLAACQEVLVRLIGSDFGRTESAAEYATLVHRWALRRRLQGVGSRIAQQALDLGETPERLAAQAVTRLTGIRDADAGDVTALTLAELMEAEDDDPEWVIPGLLERGDRMMLTGSEGIGKSALSRQLVMSAAAGVHPFSGGLIPPVKAYILDVENKPTQVRRESRPLLRWLYENGADDPRSRVLVDAIYPRRINVTSDRDLSRIHQTLDAWQPDVVVLGPIYRMSPRALQTDDDAHPFLAALDTLTERGCALIVEAHAGHAQEGTGKAMTRSLRPRGSSALLGWPEFGLGLRGLGGGFADLEPWRGHRSTGRGWPSRLRQAPGNRWLETHPDDRPPPPEEPPMSGPVLAQDTLV